MVPFKTTDNFAYYHKVYLKSDHWAFVKRIMFKRFPACQVCGSTKQLDVHHRRYRMLYDVLPSDLAVLCRYHHSQIHEKVNGKKPILEVVDERLSAILPVLNETPKQAYTRIANRFFRAFVKCSNNHKLGSKLKGRLRRVLFDEKPKCLKKHSFTDLLIFATTPVAKPKIQESGSEKEKKQFKHKTRYRSPYPEIEDMRKRYMKVAIRYFTVARKIYKVHKIKVLPEARKLLRMKSACVSQVAGLASRQD